MTPLDTEILAALTAIARKDLEFQGELTPALTLKADLQLDSMAMIIVAVGLENRFRVKLAEEDAGDLVTVADLIALVVRRIQEQGA
jgi:acyl carrier protein